MDFILATEELKPQWNAFVAAHALDGGVLQSWEWGEVVKSPDALVFHACVIDGSGQILAAALLIRTEIHFEYAYLYAPRGPVIAPDAPGAAEALFAGITELARTEGCFMVQFDPAWPVAQYAARSEGTEEPLDPGQPAPELQALLTAHRARKSAFEHQSKCSMIIDITPSEQELAGRFKPKTRYNIGLAVKRGVTVRLSRELSDLESFWNLAKQTSERDKFAHHPKDHYKKMIEMLGGAGTLELFLAEYQGKVIAAALVSFFGTTATYLHGASASLYRDAMAPYLLQWDAILQAKRRGCIRYDFGGINGLTYHNANWAGITRFKAGFGGATPPTEFIGNYEIVIKPVVYAAYSFAKQLRG
jgi:peptidoglycan pentaglycine glycine transferase (the first glycine)